MGAPLSGGSGGPGTGSTRNQPTRPGGRGKRPFPTPTATASSSPRRRRSAYPMTDADGPWPDRRLRGLIDECAGAHVTDLVETAGEQGASGARLRYFHGASGGEALRFVAKFATRLERQAIRLLDGQGQAVPHSACSPNVAG